MWGTVYAIGNVFEKGTVTQSSDIFRIGDSCGASCPIPDAVSEACTSAYWTTPAYVYIVNNTFIYDNTQLGYGYIYSVRSSASWAATNAFVTKNNVYYANPSSGLNLYVPGNKAPTQTTDTGIITSDPGWVSKAGYNYHLGSGASTLINQGTAPGTGNGVDLTPYYQYKDTASMETRTITGTIDVGAYEYGGGSGTVSISGISPIAGLGNVSRSGDASISLSGYSASSGLGALSYGLSGSGSVYGLDSILGLGFVIGGSRELSITVFDVYGRAATVTDIHGRPITFTLPHGNQL